MSHFTTSDGLHLLFLAKASEIGLLVQTNEPRRAMACLVASKRLPEAQGADLDDLQICLSPLEGGDIIIVNKTIRLGEGLQPNDPPL